MKFMFRNKAVDMEGYSDNDHIYKNILLNQTFYEIDLLEYIRYFTSGKENILCIDIGANIGNHSVYFGKYIAGKLISIEPNTEILPILKRNLSKNINHYTIYECGVGAYDAYGAIIMPEDSDENIGMAKIQIRDNVGSDCFEIRTLDEIFDDWNNTNNDYNANAIVIKIDVEGFELNVLKGGNCLLQKYKPDLFVEAATIEHYTEIREYLAGFGYKSLTRWAATPVYHFSYSPSLYVQSKVFLYKQLHEIKVKYWKIRNIYIKWLNI